MNPTTTTTIDFLKLTNHAGFDRVEVYINDCGDGPEIVVDVFDHGDDFEEQSSCAWLSADDAEALIDALRAAVAHLRA